MQHIWAPWRIAYIEAKKPEKCILCEKPKETKDAENYILFRGKLNFVMLNSYPYNPGHVMVAPYRHIDSFELLNAEERAEHFEIISRAIVVMREVFKPGGFNLGMNIGRIAGAGIDDHIHSHIVPRWQGDTNFITTIADVRVMPDALAATYEKLKGKL